MSLLKGGNNGFCLCATTPPDRLSTRSIYSNYNHSPKDFAIENWLAGIQLAKK